MTITIHPTVTINISIATVIQTVAIYAYIGTVIETIAMVQLLSVPVVPAIVCNGYNHNNRIRIATVMDP